MQAPNIKRNSYSVQIPMDDQRKVVINGDLIIPTDPRTNEPLSQGIVVFAHGSGSSRFSPRNRFVAERLNREGLSTLLVDLLTNEEEREDEYTREFRFNIPLLANRLVVISNQWLPNQTQTQQSTKNMKVGFFGASTGGGAAIIAAVMAGQDRVHAVVSRGGRVDLAGGEYLREIKAPTLFIVGGLDSQVLSLNRTAFAHIQLPDNRKSLRIVEGATHLFEEPGTLEKVADLAAEWFAKWLK